MIKSRTERQAPERAEYITIRTQCGRERWDMQAETTWGEAELIRALMIHYRPVAHQPPSLAIFDEDSKRRSEFELNENWAYVLCVGKKGGKRQKNARTHPDGAAGAPRGQSHQQEKPAQNFLEDSTPETSGQQTTESEGESEAPPQGRWVKCGRHSEVMLMDPAWDADEVTGGSGQR
jgi:hypothetical protein